MGLSPFGNCSVYPVKTTDKTFAPNPNPINFKIIEMQSYGYNVVAQIAYPDCMNFEGMKICLFLQISKKELENRTSIDPHFSENGFSPFARFKPTEEGWNAAVKLAREL